jgi:hypothetical protein
MRLIVLAALISVVSGVTLSNFRALILFPSFVLAGIFILGTGIATSERGLLIALVVIFAAVGLQLGYLVGTATLNVCWPVVARFWTNASNVRRQRSASVVPRRRYISGPF